MTSDAPGEPFALVGASLGGRYRLTRHVHDGPHASLFEAVDADGKALSLKVFRRDLVSDDALSRFIRTASAMAGAGSPRLVPILDVGHDLERDLVFVAMPLVRGEDLGAVLRRTGPLAPPVALRIMLQATEAVAAAHALDIVHRNVKPSNFLLETAEDGSLFVRLSDVAIGTPPLMEGKSRQSWLSLQYLSPEQAQSSKSIDLRTDVFSLGATMYELLAGGAPWEGASSLTELLLALSSRDAPALQERAPWIESAIVAVVQRAMSRDPDRRFPSAEALAVRLRALVGDDARVTPAMLAPLDPALKATIAPRIEDEPPNAFAPTLDSNVIAAGEVADALLGHRLGGRYRVVRLLGQGGMGAVYEVEGAGGARFAAKVILREVAEQNVALVARFLREGRAVTRVQSPHVTKTIELGTDITLGVPFIIMELLEGRDLGTLMRERGAIEAVPLLRVFLQAARGLAAAHADGIIHRDVKPANIFLHAASETAPLVTKICDFGLAKAAAGVAGDHSSHELTRSGGMLGTPYYMSPEHATNPRSVDARTDVWSLTASLFEGLSGRRLWSNHSSLGELLAAIWSQPIPALREIAPALDPAISALVERGLARDASRRFASMEEMIAALEPLVGGSDRVTFEELARVDPAKLGLPTRSPRAESAVVFGQQATVHAPTPPEQVQNTSVPRPSSMVSLDTGSTRTQPPVEPDHARAAARRSRVWRGVALGTVGAALLAGAALVAPRDKGGAAKDGGAVIAAATASSPEFGSTMSPNAEAVAAYRSGMQAFRDGAGDMARAKLEKAAEIDPSFAAAHLRRMLLAPQSDADARKHAADANQFRASLSEHDRALLEAFLPWTSVPPETAATERKMAELVAQHPEDADYAYFLCRIRMFFASYKEGVTACTAASRLDPGLVDALRMKALNLIYLDDVPAALETYDACLKVSHFATSCLYDLNRLQTSEGRCEEAVASARSWMALDPSSSLPYRALANALAGTGAPTASIRESLDRAWERMADSDRSRDRPQILSAMAILEGDFAAYEAQMRAWEKAIANSTEDWDHVSLALWRLDVDVELGRYADAARHAKAYLSQRAAWNPTLESDYSILVRDFQRRAGATTKEDFAKERDRWLAQSKQFWNVAGHPPGLDWSFAYAQSAVDAAEAEEALAVLPRFLPLPDPLTRAPYIDEGTANVYLLAGKPAAALPIAERTARSCMVLDQPIEMIHGELLKGKALEALGESSKACDAYAAVRRHWGASAESRSAAAAHAAMGRLHCRPQ